MEVGAIAHFNIIQNTPTTTTVASSNTSQPVSLSLNLAVNQGGQHPPGCPCPVCSGQRAISVKTNVVEPNVAKNVGLASLATGSVQHGAGCNCPVCSGKRAISVKTNISTSTAVKKAPSFASLATGSIQHGAGCNCPICSGRRSISVKTPIYAKGKAANAGKALIANNNGGRIANIAFGKAAKASVAQATAAKGRTVSVTTPALKSGTTTAARNGSTISGGVERGAVATTTNTASASRGAARVAGNATVATGKAINIAAKAVSRAAQGANGMSQTSTAGKVSLAKGQVIAGKQAAITGMKSAITGMSAALSRAANVRVKGNILQQSNVAMSGTTGLAAMKAGAKPVKLNMAFLNTQDNQLILKGKKGQLAINKPNAKNVSGKLSFGENAGKKVQGKKLPKDMPPMISFNALSNAVRSKDINKKNLAKLFMMLAGKFMNEDQITDDLEGMFGIWKDHIKKLKEKKERQQQEEEERKHKNQQEQDDEQQDQEEQEGKEELIAA